MMFFDYCDKNPEAKLPHLRRVVCGGSAMPKSQIRRFITQYGVQVLHAWGMTEMSPLGTTGNLHPKFRDLPLDERINAQAKQGRQVWGCEMKIVDDDGKEQPRDGKAVGELLVRGPWIIKSYYREGKLATDRDSWFATGDVASLDPDGCMQITDRSKDVIKTGGEWISSIDLENEAVGFSKLAEAAVISVPHPKWQERPLLVVVPKPDKKVSRDEVLEYLKPRVAKWWLPDDVIITSDPLPRTATGKLQKNILRTRYKSHVLPTQITSAL